MTSSPHSAGSAASTRLPDLAADAAPGRSPVVGIDVGGTKVAAIALDAAGRVLCRAERPMLAGDPRDGVRRIAETVREAVAGASLEPGVIGGVGMGIPGLVDPDAGVVNLAVNLGWTRVPVRDLLEAELDVPCAVENDVRVAAAGLIAPDGPASFAYVAVGTGIGAGIVLDRRLYRGSRGMAGEIGHVIQEPDGERCVCGLRGCLEAISSGPAIARAAGEALATGRRSQLDPADVTTVAVYRAAAAGDQLAGEIVGRASRVFARAIHMLVMAWDLERVYVGGGVAQAGDAFLDPVQAELDVLRGMSPLTNQQLTRDTIVLLPPDYDAVARGAAALAVALAGSGEAGTRARGRRGRLR